MLRAGKNYKEGEEFFASYGPKGAAGYLEENGYVYFCGPLLVIAAVGVAQKCEAV